jgi:hypothetical protein
MNCDISRQIDSNFFGFFISNFLQTRKHRDAFNTLNAELNPICHLLALLRAHPILHVSRISVNGAVLKWLRKSKYINIIKLVPWVTFEPDTASEV